MADWKRRRLQLYKEALAVGVAFVPLLFLVSKTTTALMLGGEAKPYIDGALAGFLFHITAEETGVNGWYLTESYAANKVLGKNKYVNTEQCFVGGVSGLGRLALPQAIRNILQHANH